MKKYFLYALIVMELLLAFFISVGNEYGDFLSSFIIAVIILIIELPILYVSVRKKTTLTLISLTGVFYLINLISFYLNKGSDFIGMKWPTESYHHQRPFVIWMLIGAIVFQMIKLFVIERSKKNIENSSSGFSV